MSFMAGRSRAWLRWAPALFFAVAIFMFSATPGDEVAESFEALNTTAGSLNATVQSGSPTVSEVPLLPPAIDWLKVGHGIGYFCLGVSVLFALLKAPKNLVSALALCVFYAVTDELHQGLTPERSASGRDVLLDSLAALAGILICLGIARWLAARRRAENFPG
jgi:VanZ family protein